MSRPFIAWFAVLCIASCIAAVMAVLTSIDVRADNRRDGYVDAAIVFVLDVSGSMDREEMRVMREGHIDAFQHPDVLQAIREGAVGRIAVSIVEFSEDARIIVPWIVVDAYSAPAFGSLFDNVGRSYRGNTCIACGLMVASGLLDALPFIATRRIVNVVGDGPENVREEELPAMREMMIGQGVTINALALTFSVAPTTLPDFFRDEVSGGPAHFMIEVRSLTDLPFAIRRKIVLELG